MNPHRVTFLNELTGKGIEVYKGKAIFFSLGNFAEETPHHLPPPAGAFHSSTSPKYGYGKHLPGVRDNAQGDRRYSIMVKCVIRNKAIERVSFFPVWINQNAEPRFLSPQEPGFQQVVDYMAKWCDELGIQLRVSGDEVIIGPREGH